MTPNKFPWLFLAVCTLVALTLPVRPAFGAEKGMLRIVTEPGDAQIFINGKRKGNSPAEVGQSFAAKLDEGTYSLVANKADGTEHEWHAEKKDVFVAEDTMQTVTMKMERRETEAGRIAREGRELKEKLAKEERERQEKLAKEEQERQEKLAKKLALEAQERKNAEELKRKYPNGIPEPKMVSIPAGSFSMGCGAGDDCRGDEKPVHTVALAAFQMSATEVTFEQYDDCVAFGGCDHLPKDYGWGRGNRPVIDVSWDEAQRYIAWLNGQTGKNYRLPSEAEWEYGARAGSNAKYSWGNEAGSNQANCAGCDSQWAGKKTAPVASFQANAFGLYDMHGNVWEWCQDWYGDKYYGDSPSSNPTGPTSGSNRVSRGGSWSNLPGYMRAAYRLNDTADYRHSSLGFRLVASQVK